MSHELVGGSTTARGVFGFSDLRLVISDDPLQRTLAHVIKFSERPTPCPLPVATPHYTTDDRLCLRLFDQPVLFPSGFSWSGWGIRRLIPAELSQAFDLPAYLAWDERFASSLVPIQTFRVIGDSVLDCLRPRECGEPPSQKHRSHEVGSASTRQGDPPVWLGRLGRWLPGSWADAEISTKAVKADNADVDYRSWNLRISLVFPSVGPSVIRGFETLGLRRWRQMLSKSFFAYLRRQYGPRWLTRLHSVQRKRVSDTIWSRKRSVEQQVPEFSCRKRSRTQGTEVLEHGATVLSHDKGGLDSDQLVRDVACGTQILNQVMRSS